MTGFDLIVRGGRVVTPQGVLAADIGVRAGRIAEVGTLTGGAETVIDATGCIVLPGGVDVHCHIEQRSGMGRMNADTFETATRSALIGGTTTTISFAAQEKGERLSDRVADYAARAARAR
ncbi:MAG: amidohydrolase family protein [Paracoccaceae bacterium]